MRLAVRKTARFRLLVHPQSGPELPTDRAGHNNPQPLGYQLKDLSVHFLTAPAAPPDKAFLRTQGFPVAHELPRKFYLDPCFQIHLRSLPPTPRLPRINPESYRVPKKRFKR
jgi:hypothetical protein